jgi:hypothetical protein
MVEPPKSGPAWLPSACGFTDADSFLSVRIGRLQCEQDRQRKYVNKIAVRHALFSRNGCELEPLVLSGATIGISLGATSVGHHKTALS